MFNDSAETLNYNIDDLGFNVRNIKYNGNNNNKIRVSEVEIALRKMESGKVVGPDGIPIEVWKCLGKMECCDLLIY